MTIAVIRIRLRLPSRTLKEKRGIVKSTVVRLQSRFNASVAEVDDLDTVDFAVIAAACVSNDSGHANAQVQAISRAVEEWRLDLEVVEIETELIHG